ncbi:unnamed protein product [Urochloa humidicola]
MDLRTSTTLRHRKNTGSERGRRDARSSPEEKSTRGEGRRRAVTQRTHLPPHVFGPTGTRVSCLGDRRSRRSMVVVERPSDEGRPAEVGRGGSGGEASGGWEGRRRWGGSATGGAAASGRGNGSGGGGVGEDRRRRG